MPTAANSPEQGVNQSLAHVLADVAQARMLAAQALDAARASGDVRVATLAMLALGLADLREGELIPGAARLQDAQAWLITHDHERGQWLAQHLRAQLHRLRGELAEALALLTDLHRHAAARPVVDAFHTVMALGTVQGMSDCIYASLHSYFQGVDLARRSGVPSLEVNALNNLGALQLDLHNLDDALPLLRRSLDLAQAIGSRRQTVFAAGNLVQCLCAIGQPSEALDVARQHLIALIRPQDPPALQRDEEIAQALLDSDLPAEAKSYLDRAAGHDALTNPVSACRAWLQARLSLAQGQPAAALQCCLDSRNLVDDEAVVPVDRIRLAEFTAEVAAGQNQWRLAFDFQHRAYRLKDLLLGRAAKARYLSLQIAHELQSTRDERDAAREMASQLELANTTLRKQMAANERLRRQLERLALHDPLTRLANRRHLFQAGQALLERSRRDQSVVSVALIDLDHFKTVNDQHGHDVGDRVLVALADLLRGAVRKGDICARHGGEEFTLVLPAATPQTALERLQQLLVALKALNFVGTAGALFRCSFSAGVASAVAGPEDLHSMLRRADQALYRAKAAGRSQVCLADIQADLV